MKEAVLRQILQHTLSTHATGAEGSLITLEEEQLETLQALLEPVAEGNQRPPLVRNLGGHCEDQAREDTPGEQAPPDGVEVVRRSPGDAHPMLGSGEGGEDARRVAQFMRRHGPGDALRIAASGLIETQMGRNNETILVRTIASEVHTVAWQILHSTPQLENEGESLERGTKRLYAGEVAQWEQHMQDEETEVEEASMALLATGEAPTLVEQDEQTS